MSWNAAQNMCEDIHGSLVSIDSHEEMDFIRMLFRPSIPLKSEKTFLLGVLSKVNVGGILCHIYHYSVVTSCNRLGAEQTMHELFLMVINSFVMG